MSLDHAALDLIDRIMSSPQSERQKLEQILRASAKWRSQLLGLTMAQRDGTVVRRGPFGGMAYLPEPSEGGVTAKLLGAYEAALQPFFESLPERGYDAVLNVGCAEGYYAVGCARLLPGTPVIAWDIDPKAREKCAILARLNGVEGQVDIRAAFDAPDLAVVRTGLEAGLGRRPGACLVMDCEGAEFALLDPARADFDWLDLIVEVHPGRERSLEELADRFRRTHRITVLEARTAMPDLPSWLAGLGHLDQLLAVWEWRSVPTPWLVMESLSGN